MKINALTRLLLGKAGCGLAVLTFTLSVTPFAAWAQNSATRNPYHPQLTKAMPPLDTLVEQFEQIAFSSEFGGRHRNGRIVKWTKPIRVRVSGAGAAQYMGAVREILDRLAALSGLRIDVVNRNANFTVTFVDQRGPGQDPCATFFKDNGKYSIARVRIIISRLNPKQRQHCIVEEITQAIGLSNDSKIIFPSIFNDNSRQQGLFPWDEIMVQTLYNRRLHPGISKTKARPIVRKTLSQLTAQIPATTSSPAPKEQPVLQPEPDTLPRDMPFDPKAFK